MRPVDDWGTMLHKLAAKVAMTTLAGVGLMAESHVEYTDFTRHHRRPCSPAEIKYLLEDRHETTD